MGMGSRGRELGELIRFGQAVGQQMRGSAGGQLRDTIRGKVAGWRDPRARLLRRRRRSAKVTTVWSGLTLLGGVGVYSEHAVLMTPGGIAVTGATVLFGYFAATSALRTSKLYRTPLPETPVPAVPLPRNGSMARAPMRTLAEAESSLNALLVQLSTPTRAGIAPVPIESVAHARASAAEAAEAIRTVSTQLIAVERARDIAPSTHRRPLVEGIRQLRAQLDEGVDGYRTLVAAAGQAVVASSNTAPNQALVDASDRLSGLASALRELAADPGA
jgi:hypothetical protein